MARRRFPLAIPGAVNYTLRLTFAAGAATFTDGIKRQVRIPREDWIQMGQPSAISITVIPHPPDDDD
jgi:hypothetical protein